MSYIFTFQSEVHICIYPWNHVVIDPAAALARHLFIYIFILFF